MDRTARTTVARGLRRAGALATAVALAAGLLTATSTPAAAASGRDGRTAATALASCWDVKQTDPSAASGVYWLWTPSLPYPQQFYCDQTTDGGGWVLIGRGRENWAFLPEGQGSTDDVATTVTGTAAFAPKHLSADTVNGLLDGAEVTALTDGVRIRRATNTAGTGWQEVRVRPRDMGPWRWTITNGYYLRSIRFGGTTYTRTGTPGSTKAWTFSHACPTTAKNCLDLRRKKSHAWRPGFGYGPKVTGTTSTKSYLWQPAGASGAAVPFAQVYLRPKLRWGSLTITPAASLGERTVRSMVDDVAENQTYGVSGLANGRSTERDTEVRSMAQIGNRMYVGGNFARVRAYAGGSGARQRYLAAFSVTTGSLVRTFRPRLNGKVDAVHRLPDGNLVVGGEFTMVNGKRRAGLVVLDPGTGAIVPKYRFGLQRRSGSKRSAGTVTTLDVAAGWLYLGGRFTHVRGGGSRYVYAKRAARIRLSTSRPDRRWNPAFDGTPIFVLASADGDRVYYGGFMRTMNDGRRTADKFVALRTTRPARPVTGLKSWVPSTPTPSYQQTAVEASGRLVLGGSEHSLHFYRRSTLGFVRGNITRGGESGTGGDFQASVVSGSVVYASCHCQLSANFGGSRQYTMPLGYDVVDSFRYVGAYDLRTGRFLDQFMPWIKTRAVRGPWALTVDSRGCLWAGGDLTSTRRRSDRRWQASGGFARFCRNDTTAPTTPTGLTSSAAGDTVTVRFTGSTDNRSGTVRYIVYRDDVPVAATSSWKITLPASRAAGSYTVRAYDPAGNTTAASSPLVVS